MKTGVAPKKREKYRDNADSGIVLGAMASGIAEPRDRFPAITVPAGGCTALCTDHSRRTIEREVFDRRCYQMNYLRASAGIGFALTLMFRAAVASGQPVSQNLGASGTGRSDEDSAFLMDQKLYGEIKQAWSEGKNATLAMSFQENGEIAMGEGKEKEATQYFQTAEQELGKLQPEPVRNTSY
jgi:hypothetical protein